MEVESGKVCRDNIFSSLVALSKNIFDSDNNKALKQKEIISSYIELGLGACISCSKYQPKFEKGPS